VLPANLLYPSVSIDAMVQKEPASPVYSEHSFVRCSVPLCGALVFMLRPPCWVTRDRHITFIWSSRYYCLIALGTPIEALDSPAPDCDDDRCQRQRVMSSQEGVGNVRS
jgi:hypothetical protein